MSNVIVYYTALVFEALIGVFGIRLYEEPPYKVITRVSDRIEIRQYGPRVAAEVDLPASGKAGREEAFRLLFAYIAGANDSSASGNTRIAMTVPVEVREKERMAMMAPVRASEAIGALRMQFFLPAKYTQASAPKPLDDRVRLVTVPGETIATLRFSGSGSEFSARQFELIAMLTGSQWQPTGAPYALSYDAPFTLPFLRRNEAAIAVAKTAR
jgi:hypothetical protein